jgi:hypothetical protein
VGLGGRGGAPAQRYQLGEGERSLPSSCKEFPPTAIILITVFDFACVAIMKALSIMLAGPFEAEPLCHFPAMTRNGPVVAHRLLVGVI